MKKFEFDKLIRSKLPSRMIQEGVIIKGQTLDEKQYVLKLKEKLLEEAEEVSLANSIEDIKTELADVLEVIHALTEHYQISLQELEETRLKKRQINGYFMPDNYVDYIEVAEDNHTVIKYLLDKNRPYKLITN